MRATVALVAVVGTALALAGCTGGATGGDDLAAAAEDIDVAATATTGVIRGVAVDEVLRPVAGAAVTLAGGDGGATTTNEDGAFGFDGLAPGTYFLTVSADGYHPVQQSAEVVAGVSDPEPLKVLLAAIPRADPFIETLKVALFVSSSAWAAGGGVTAGGFGVIEGGFGFTEEISPNGTVAQTEFVWQKTSDLGTSAMASGGTYTEDDDVDAGSVTGPSPLVARANATAGSDKATQVSYTFWAWPTDPVPAGVHANQPVDVFINVFHNFRPDEGWTFAGNGAHPLPPA